MSEEWRDLFPIVLQGTLALAAALAAVAFRRRTRILTPPGFIMLALGFALEIAVPRHAGAPPWSKYVLAAALALIWCGLIRLVVESVETWIRRTRMHLSTITTELAVTILYAVALLIVSWKVLGFDAGQLFALPVAFTLASGWLQHRDLFAGFLIQSQKPFRPGDWVRVGDHEIGQVHETGWRATRIRTRTRENLTIPSDVMAKEVITNYSSYGHVADEVDIALGYEQSPGLIEAAILGMLSDIPEILRAPAPEIGPWEFGDWSITYRIRYWLADYALQEDVRARVARSLWFVMQRHALGAPAPATLMAEAPNGAALNGNAHERVRELHRVDLFSELSNEELQLVAPSTRAIEFGRGERLIRQGEEGDCFFILRRGEVEIIREAENGHGALVVGAIQSSSPKNFFGEIALLKGEPRNTTVRAKTDVEVLRVDRAGFTQLFRARPWIASEIAKIAAAREHATLAQAAGESASQLQVIAEQQSRLLLTMRRIFDF